MLSGNCKIDREMVVISNDGYCRGYEIKSFLFYF